MTTKEIKNLIKENPEKANKKYQKIISENEIKIVKNLIKVGWNDCKNMIIDDISHRGENYYSICYQAMGSWIRGMGDNFSACSNSRFGMEKAKKNVLYLLENPEASIDFHGLKYYAGVVENLREKIKEKI